MGLIDSIIGAESGGNPNAANPRSSASGLGQFIDSTWIDTIKAARPDLAQGKTDADLIALKTDPALSREMTDFYASQNAGILSKNGLPVTPGTTYLAHFAGPQGAVSVLNADPSSPVASVMGPAAMKANPFLQGMTVGDLRAWADRKMGGAQPAPQATPAPANVVQASPPMSADNGQQWPIMAQANYRPPAAPLNLAPPAAPIFAPQPQQQQPSQAAPAAPFEPPAPIQAAPIFAPPRRQIDLSKLRAAFKAPTFTRG